MAERDLDVIVFGATGVTGRRVASYLARRASQAGLRWAAAGRSQERLAQALAQEGVSPPELILADVGDQESLTAMAARARVVLNLVGPYTLHGRPVIEACIAAGSHYADLCGELPFVREVIDELGATAAAAGVKVVQVCGFEALPPDLLVALAASRARELWAEELFEVELEVGMQPPPGMPRPSDGMSGGTFQSLTAVADRDDASSITDPALLIADSAIAAAVRRVSPITLAPRRGADGAVIAPMSPAAFINPAVIHRSAALAASAQGRPASPFRYREGIRLEGGPLTLPARWALAGAASGTQVGVRALARARSSIRRPAARAMGRFGPASGFGPAPERLEGWRWRMDVSARTSSGKRVQSHLLAEGHPGYLATARMLGEAGVLLAQEGASPDCAGCLTPAAALGIDSIGRFEHAGLHFSLE